MALLPVRAVDPLNHNVPIVDEQGKPTPQFIRQWVLARVVNLTVGDTEIAVEVLRDLITSAQAALAALDAGLALLESAVADAESDIDDLEAGAVAAGTGLEFDAVITNQLNIKDTAVTPGTYDTATHTLQITVDQQGRLTGVVAT